MERCAAAWLVWGWRRCLAYGGKVPVRYNVRNLQVRWRTTLLTGLAFTLVIALLTVMLAFVNGMYKLTQGSGQPGNVIVLAEGSTDESFSSVPIVDAGDIELQPGVLRDEQDRPLASRETYVVVNQPVQVRQPGRPRGRFTQVRGVEDAELSAAVHGLSLVDGGEWVTREGRPLDRRWPGSDSGGARRRHRPRAGPRSQAGGAGEGEKPASGWRWARRFRSAGERGSSSA